MTSEPPLQEFVDEIERARLTRTVRDWCGTDENVLSVRDSVTREVSVSICDACVLNGVWRDEVGGASQTVLLAYAGYLVGGRD